MWFILLPMTRPHAREVLDTVTFGDGHRLQNVFYLGQPRGHRAQGEGDFCPMRGRLDWEGLTEAVSLESNE